MVPCFGRFVVHAKVGVNKEQFYQFIGGQTHFSTSWYAKMSMFLNEPK